MPVSALSYVPALAVAFAPAFLVAGAALHGYRSTRRKPRPARLHELEHWYDRTYPEGGFDAR